MGEHRVQHGVESVLREFAYECALLDGVLPVRLPPAEVRRFISGGVHESGGAAFPSSSSSAAATPPLPVYLEECVKVLREAIDGKHSSLLETASDDTALHSMYSRLTASLPSSSPSSSSSSSSSSLARYRERETGFPPSSLAAAAAAAVLPLCCGPPASIPEQVRATLREGQRLGRECADPCVAAAWLLCAFLSIRPFEACNCTVALLLASLPLLKAYALPMVVKAAEVKTMLIPALRTASKGDLSSLVFYIRQALVRTIVTAISMGEESRLSAYVDVLSTISSSAFSLPFPSPFSPSSSSSSSSSSAVTTKRQPPEPLQPLLGEIDSVIDGVLKLLRRRAVREDGEGKGGEESTSISEVTKQLPMETDPHACLTPLESYSIRRCLLSLPEGTRLLFLRGLAKPEQIHLSAVVLAFISEDSSGGSTAASTAAAAAEWQLVGRADLAATGRTNKSRSKPSQQQPRQHLQRMDTEDEEGEGEEEKERKEKEQGEGEEEDAFGPAVLQLLARKAMELALAAENRRRAEEQAEVRMGRGIFVSMSFSLYCSPSCLFSFCSLLVFLFLLTIDLFSFRSRCCFSISSSSKTG